MSKEEAKDELIKVLYSQVIDLTMMSKIELGDDVIAEIKRLRAIISDEELREKYPANIEGGEMVNWNKVGENNEKRIYKIEVGVIAPEDAEEYVKQIQESFKKPIPLNFKLPEK